MSNGPGESPVSGGRALFSGRIFGFPVHLDLSFVLIMGVLGYLATGGYLRNLLIWLAITPFAVLTHELGHAFTARATGAAPQIALAGFGGVTTYVPPGPLSRARQLGISLAGPAVGLAIGAALWLIQQATEASTAPGSWQDSALAIGIWTTVGWSLFNLLPIVPLDGGQAMRELLPGSPEVRARRAAAISIVTAAFFGVVAYVVFREPFIALFLGFFAVSAYFEMRALSQPREITVSPEQAVVHLLWQGEPARARQVLESLPEGTPVDLTVHGAVLALSESEADRRQGRALLDQERAARPDDTRVAAVLVLTLALQHDWDGLMALLQSPTGAIAPASAIERAVQEARGIGREDVAGRITHLGRREPAPGPAAHPWDRPGHS